MGGESFGWAIKQLKNGSKVYREGWNGKGMWIELQNPDEHSKMTRLISTIKLLGILLLCLLILPVSFIVFTLWELLDKKGSRAFWDEMYDPYE